MAQPNKHRQEFRFLNWGSPRVVAACLFISLILYSHVSFCNVLYYAIRIDSTAVKRACIIQTSESQAHVREKTNKNDAPEIYEYFRAAGYKGVERWTPKARPWCAAYVYWVYNRCGVKLPKGNYAAVRTWANLRHKYPPKNGVPQAGDVVTYKPYSHAEIVKNYPLDPRIKVFYTNGGNTSAGNKYEGVYINIPRPKAYIMYVISVVK